MDTKKMANILMGPGISKSARKELDADPDKTLMAMGFDEGERKALIEEFKALPVLEEEGDVVGQGACWGPIG